MRFYLENISDVFASVNSTPNGLTQEQATQRLEKNGKNKLTEAKKESLAKRFFSQLLDPMIIILIVAATISGVLAAIEGNFPSDVIIIMIVVIINSVLGVYQESKAEAAIEALQEMSASTSKVIRDGKIEVVKSEDLVAGDVIMLEAGDAVPADARVFECASMKVEEAALTGESVPINKMIDKLVGTEKGDVSLGDRKNMVYMGSVIVYGRGKAVVVETGMQTEMGKIADAISKAEEGQTPLQIKLTQLSKVLTVIVVGISIFIFGFTVLGNMLKGIPNDLETVLEIFMIAVSLAVAAIPEGLVAVVTIVLSIGVTNMSRKKAIIRKLTAVETLGCAEIICSDKTGTLTQNKMTVIDYYGSDEEKLATAMSLCTDAEIDETSNVVGEPTECALVNYALSHSLNKNDLKNDFPRVGEAPFDSVRKMMSTVHKCGDSFIQYTKGAPDELLKKCSHAEIDGKVVPLTDEIKEKIVADNKRMAGKALRVLSVAYKKYDSKPEVFDPEHLENELVFLGLTGMIDPVRPEVKDAIEECRSAGIRPIMITGDHKDTAVAIAMELGIIDDPSHAITGAQLNEISDEEFKETVGNYSVYARVQPEHKVRIVNAWRERGMVTAMTGDGVNDAPSIKSADIGIGMGITGTDVTKNVADMVLADDNFATIVSAVSEGRRVYDNIRKAIQFLLSSNLSEVVTIFVASIMSFTILRPVHLLWINLVTDSFPALALGMEKAEANLMERKPRSPKSGIFSGGVGVDIFYQGTLVAILTLIAYFIGEFIENGAWSIVNSDDGMTMAFLTMSMCEIFHSFNMRSQRSSVISMGIKGSHNKYLYLAMIASLVMTTAVIYVPFLKNAFDFTSISATEYFISMALAVSVIPIVEIVKVFQRRHTSKKA
ncbi:MAG TPA: cation-translocating P-type ATPase [Clostridia bacterium]|nr:cation-translocating P-type ATPase [Clostridia bacterium]